MGAGGAAAWWRGAEQGRKAFVLWRRLAMSATSRLHWGKPRGTGPEEETCGTDALWTCVLLAVYAIVRRPMTKRYAEDALSKVIQRKFAPGSSLSHTARTTSASTCNRGAPCRQAWTVPKCCIGKTLARRCMNTIIGPILALHVGPPSEHLMQGVLLGCTTTAKRPLGPRPQTCPRPCAHLQGQQLANDAVAVPLLRLSTEPPGRKLPTHEPRRTSSAASALLCPAAGA